MNKIIIIFLSIYSYIQSVHAEENDPNYCGPNDLTLARCDGHKRTFDSVVMAIHGWNGSCKTTFGEDDENENKFRSIYSLFKGKRTFDFDCFSYDSEKFDIQNHVSRLEKQMLKLRAMGYENVLFVTHSTGGVIALHYVTDRLNRAINKNIHDEINIPIIIAWATPINGLRSQINTGGAVLNFFGRKQNTLRQLNDDNDYLSNLRSKLTQYPNLLDQVNIEKRLQYDTRVHFYHGDNDDWVVLPILKNHRDEGWIWPSPKGEIINTEVGHLVNIKESGNPIVHKYPERILDSETIINLPLGLNLDEIFPLTGLTEYDKTLFHYQEAMVRGVSYNSQRIQENLNTDIFIEFIGRILLHEYPRSKEIDYLLLEELEKKSFSLDLINQEAHLLQRVLLFVDNILSRFNTKTKYSLQSPGHGEADFIKGVLEFAGEIESALRDIPNPSPEIETARINIANIFLDTLDSTQQAVLEKTIKYIADASKYYPDNIIAETALVEKVSNFYIPRVGDLGFIAKEQIGATLIDIANRGSDVSIGAQELLNEKVIFRNENVPLHKTFQNDNLDQLLLNTPNIILEQENSTTRILRRQRMETLGELSVNAGWRGNNKDIITIANDKGFILYGKLTEVQKDKATELLQQWKHRNNNINRKYPLQKSNNPGNWDIQYQELIKPQSIDIMHTPPSGMNMNN